MLTGTLKSYTKITFKQINPQTTQNNPSKAPVGQQINSTVHRIIQCPHHIVPALKVPFAIKHPS